MEMKSQKKASSAASYLGRPYARILTPDSDGTYLGQIAEFPGCIATGDSMAEALTNLERVAESWIESALAQGQSVPEPKEEVDYSGKFVLRLAKSLHKTAAEMAERDGVSLNQFIVTAIGVYVGGNVATERVSAAANFVAMQQFNILQVEASGRQGINWRKVPSGAGSQMLTIRGELPFVKVA